MVPPRAPASRRRRRFFRRHPMGLPSVLFVLVLAVAGFWWTLAAPGGDAPAGAADPAVAASGIPRGCQVVAADASLDPCAGADETPLLLPAQPPLGHRLACESSWGAGQYYFQVWENSAGLDWRLHWNLPDVSDPVHPLASYWVAAWSGPASFPDAIHVGGVRSGWAAFPAPPAAGRPVTIHAGPVALGGTIDGGLGALEVVPFGFSDDGAVRLAAFVNGGEIVVEIPHGQTHSITRSDEALQFVQVSDLVLDVPRCTSG